MKTRVQPRRLNLKNRTRARGGRRGVDPRRACRRKLSNCIELATCGTKSCIRLGSFSQDPIGFAGGDANLYRYVGNGPTNATDPSGLEEFPHLRPGIPLATHGNGRPAGPHHWPGSSQPNSTLPKPGNVNGPPPIIQQGGSSGGLAVTQPDLNYSKAVIDNVPFAGPSTMGRTRITEIIIRSRPGLVRYGHQDCHTGYWETSVDGWPVRGYGFEIEVKYEGSEADIRIEQWVSGVSTSEYYRSTFYPQVDFLNKGGYTVRDLDGRLYGLDLSYPGRKTFTNREPGKLCYYDLPYWPIIFPGPGGSMDHDFIVIAYVIDGSSAPVVNRFNIGK